LLRFLFGGAFGTFLPIFCFGIGMVLRSSRLLTVGGLLWGSPGSRGELAPPFAVLLRRTEFCHEFLPDTSVVQPPLRFVHSRFFLLPHLGSLLLFYKVRRVCHTPCRRRPSLDPFPLFVARI
jgi:hypothetical protein